MLDFYLVRHGESIANAGAATYDPADIPLSDLGRKQAEKFAAHLKIKPDFIVCSPYLRARQTAEPVKQLFPDVPFRIWPEVREFTYLAPEKCRNTSAEERKPRVQAYWQANWPEYVDGEGAESFEDFTKRTTDVWRKLFESCYHSILVFSHEQFIKSLYLWHKEPQLPLLERMRRFQELSPIGNSEVTLLHCDEECPW